jgi:hypothetical protein
MAFLRGNLVGRVARPSLQFSVPSFGHKCRAPTNEGCRRWCLVHLDASPDSREFPLPEMAIWGRRRSSKRFSCSNRRFKFQKRSQLFIRAHNETLSVAAMPVSNERSFALGEPVACRPGYVSRARIDLTSKTLARSRSGKQPSGVQRGCVFPGPRLTKRIAKSIAATSGQKLKNNGGRKMFASSTLPEKQPA